MYFEDLFEKVRPLWRESYSLEGMNDSISHVPVLAEHWNFIDDLVDSNRDGSFNEWHGMLVWTMYQALTATAIEKWKKHKVDRILFSEIPLTLFEEYFSRNIESAIKHNSEGMKYLNKYKGFKNSNL